MSYNPYAPPTASVESIGRREGAFAYVEGSTLVVSKEALLPDICVKCAAPSRVRRTQRFVFTPPWVIVVMVLSFLIGAIVAMIVQKRGTLHLPLCDACQHRWKKANWQVAAALFAIPLSVMLGFLVAGSSENVGTIVVALLLASLVGLIVVAVVQQNVRVTSRKVDDRSITLRGVHPEAQRAIVAALS